MLLLFLDFFSFQRGGADSATGRLRPALKIFRASFSNWSQTIYILSVILKLRYVTKSHIQFYSNKQVTHTDLRKTSKFFVGPFTEMRKSMRKLHLLLCCRGSNISL